MAEFTSNGLSIDGLSAIRQKFIDTAQVKFSPLLNGQELSTDDSGVIGRLFGIVAETVAAQEEAIQLMYSSLDPNQASGIALDKLCEINGLYRLPATPATGVLTLYGDIGVTVAAGSTAKSNTTGDIFSTDDDVTFTKTLATGVEFTLDFTSGAVKAYSFNYSVMGNSSENPPITVYSTTTDTLETLALRVAQTVNNQTSDLTATVTTDGNVKVLVTNGIEEADFTEISNLTIIRSYKTVTATSTTFTAVEQPSNTLIMINSGATLGWRGVNNLYPTTESKPVETDEQLRYRYKYVKGNESLGNYTSMYFGLRQIYGVRFVNIQQNITSVTNGERTNNGVSIVVLGGTGQDIAEAIFKNLPIGTVTDGNEVYYVQDINGGSHEIRFSRPVYVPIKISMSLTVQPSFPTNGKAQIKQAIVDYFNELEVGEDIYYSRLYNPINSIDGFSVNNLKISKRDGGVLGMQDIVLKYYELATISATDILIGE